MAEIVVATMISHKHDQYFMDRAIQQAYRSSPIETAYCVGAVIVVPTQYVPTSWIKGSDESALTSDTPTATSVYDTYEGISIVATGYSRELEGNTHAEESALMKLESVDSLAELLSHACIYTTMEPCTHRLSEKQSCTDRLLAVGIPRVVIGTPEPKYFVSDCDGIERLQSANVEVVISHEYQQKCLEINQHLTKSA